MVDVSIFYEDNAKKISKFFFGDVFFPKEIFTTIDLYLDDFEDNPRAPKLVARRGQKSILQWIITRSMWTMKQLNDCLAETLELRNLDMSELILDELDHFEFNEYTFSKDLLPRRVLSGDVPGTRLLLKYFTPNRIVLNRCISDSPTLEVLKEVCKVLDLGCDTFNPSILVKFTMMRKHSFVQFLLEEFWTDQVTLQICLQFADITTAEILLEHGAEDEDEDEDLDNFIEFE